MRIIDLLNKIANGEEVPKKFIWDDNEYYLHFNKCYRCGETSRIFEEDFILENLNDEIEIIEEEKKIPEKLPYYDYSKIMSSNDKLKTIELMLEKHEKRLNDNWEKINEIIDYLKSKGDE